MTKTNIPDDAAEAFRRVKVEWNQTQTGADIEALQAAAPLIAADYLERLVAELEAVKQEMREEDGRTIRSYGLGEGIIRIRECIAGLRGGA